MDDQVPGSSVSGNTYEAGMDSRSMESKIRELAYDAYYAVLRAFRAQSRDSLSWGKADLMMRLREELKLSDDDQLFLLDLVLLVDSSQKTREWNQGVSDGITESFSDVLTDKSLQMPSKKPKTSHSILTEKWEDPARFYRGTRRGCLTRYGQINGKIGAAEKCSGVITLPDANILEKEMLRIFSAVPLDPQEIEKAKKMLREHEEALVHAIAELDDSLVDDVEEERNTVA